MAVRHTLVPTAAPPSVGHRQLLQSARRIQQEESARGLADHDAHRSCTLCRSYGVSVAQHALEGECRHESQHSVPSAPRTGGQHASAQHTRLTSPPSRIEMNWNWLNSSDFKYL